MNAGSSEASRVGIVRELHRDGLLSEEAFAAAKAMLLPASSWFSWARQMLLHVGSALVLAGIVFFFAYNWSAMGRFLKLGLVEAGIVSCVAAASLRGLHQPSGKVLLLSSSVLTGVLLAVYGQIYQTGADAFELFAAWAVLTFGWVLVSSFAALWLAWLALVNVGAILYWQQVAEPVHSLDFEHLYLALAAIDGTALCLREIGVRRGAAWLNGRWLRIVLLAALLVALSVPTIVSIVTFQQETRTSAFAAVLAWMAAAAVGHACYRFRLRDMAALTLVVLNVCVVLLTLIGKVLFFDLRSNESGALLLFALIILGVASGAAFWLRRTAEKMTDEMRADS